MGAEAGGDVLETAAGVESERPPSSARSSLVSSLVLGVVVGITEVSVATSFAALVFSGPLAGDLAPGVGLGLLAASVTIAIIAVKGPAEAR